MIIIPNFDRTGPSGKGPLTGRGAGPCGKGIRRGNIGRGRALGRGRGLGRRYANRR